MRKPLVCPIAYSDESPCGLLLRASEENGWKSPNAFISAYGVHSSKKTYSFLSLITNKSHWENVCEMFGIKDKVKCYERMKVSRGSTYDFQGIQVPYRSLKIKEPSICPDCINNKKYLPSLWDHKLITACTTHNTKLVKTCPKCKDKIKWSRKGLSTCSCGHKFISLKSSCINTEVTQYIEEVINKKDGSTLDLIFHFLEAFELFFKNINIVVDQHQLAVLAGGSILDKQKVIKVLCKHVKKVAQTFGLHPRLALLPFLRSSKQEIIKLATSTLNKLAKSKITVGKTLNTVDFPTNKLSAGKALGISLDLTQKLIDSSILEMRQQAKNCLQTVTLSSINELLILFTSTAKPKASYKTLAKVIGKHSNNKITFVNFIKLVKANKIKYSGVDISSGLLSVRVHIKPIKTKIYDYLTITDVAKICGVHRESIRFAVWCGVLKRIDSEETKGTSIYIEKNVAINFNEIYIFAGKVAKENNCSNSSLAMKLIASGIKPVSGPGIDNGLTYLFKRSDISSLDMNKVIKMKNYPTNTGRKKNSQKNNNTNEQGIPLFAVAYQLEISIPKTASLVKKGFLEKSVNEFRNMRITEKSFEFVKNIQQDTSLITLQQASTSVNENEKTFIRHWINSQFVTLIENGIDRYISKKDLTKIKSFKKKYVTSKEAGIITNTHRTHMLNLEKQKLIKPVKHLVSGNQKINLYNREQVLEVCK